VQVYQAGMYCFSLQTRTQLQSLTLSPSLVDGKVVYEDSALVRAVQHGRVLVVDEGQLLCSQLEHPAAGRCSCAATTARSLCVNAVCYVETFPSADKAHLEVVAISPRS
jgi:hypothetical protein